MPLYEYQCDACGHRFELIQKFSDPPAGTCTSCGAGPVRKLLSSPAIQFKGSGWYITDYARKGASATAGDASSKAASEASDKPAPGSAKTEKTEKTETSSSSSSGGSSSS